MTKKNVLIFLAGLLTGGCAGVFGSRFYFKKKYEKFAEEEIEKVREYYHSREQYVDKAKRENVTDEVESGYTEETREDGTLSPEKRAEIKEKLRKNREWAEKNTTNYATMYEERHGVDPADYESPSDSDDLVSEDEKAFNRHQEDKDREPEIISIEEAGNLPPGVDTATLFFYTYDETLTDEDDEVIEDPYLLLGKDIWEGICNEEVYTSDPEENSMVIVMNYAHDTCYEVQIVEESFEVSQYEEDE